MHLVDYAVGTLLSFSGLTAGLGTAMLALSPVRERVVRVLFWGAALSFGSSGIVCSATSEDYSLRVQMVVAALIAAVAAAGLVWGLAELRRHTHASLGTKSEIAPTRGPTLEANTGGRINAAGATIPGDLPFQFGRAESGGLINMPGIKVTRHNDGTITVEPGQTHEQQK